MTESFTASPTDIASSATALGYVGQDLAESVNKAVKSHGLTNALIAESVEYLAYAWQERFKGAFTDVASLAKRVGGAGSSYKSADHAISSAAKTTEAVLATASTNLQRRFLVTLDEGTYDIAHQTPAYDDYTARLHGGADITKDLRP